MAATGTGLPRLGLTWVTWRQHRAAVFGLLGLLAVYKILYHYQPGGRLWDFQLIEAAWMGGLALAGLAVALWLLRRRTD